MLLSVPLSLAVSIVCVCVCVYVHICIVHESTHAHLSLLLRAQSSDGQRDRGSRRTRVLQEHHGSLTPVTSPAVPPCLPAPPHGEFNVTPQRGSMSGHRT